MKTSVWPFSLFGKIPEPEPKHEEFRARAEEQLDDPQPATPPRTLLEILSLPDLWVTRDETWFHYREGSTLRLYADSAGSYIVADVSGVDFDLTRDEVAAAKRLVRAIRSKSQSSARSLAEKIARGSK